MEIENRALLEFAGRIGDGIVFAQVTIRRSGAGFELRHIADAETPPPGLRDVSGVELGEIARFTTEGAFRPLKSAPNLRTGWRHFSADLEALDFALGLLYPGAVADWFSARQGAAPANFREFTGRQSGMFSAVAGLSDTTAARVALACCDARFCLKQRRWAVSGAAPDPAENKSSIPCLEPCAIWLELARHAARLGQLDLEAVELGPEEIETARTALSIALGGIAPVFREGDLSSPANPRRMRLLLEMLDGISARDLPRSAKE